MMALTVTCPPRGLYHQMTLALEPTRQFIPSLELHLAVMYVGVLEDTSE